MPTKLTVPEVNLERNPRGEWDLRNDIALHQRQVLERLDAMLTNRLMTLLGRLKLLCRRRLVGGRPDETRRGRVGASSIEIGRFTYGDENITVKQWGEGAQLTIGSFCSVAREVTIFLGGNHRVDWITTYPFGHVFIKRLGHGAKGHPTTRGGVTIGDDVWIGHGVTIMSGVTIGAGSVLAAKSVVVKDVGPYQVVGGNPAQFLRKRFDDDLISLLLRLSWWTLPLDDIQSILGQLTATPTRQSLQDLVNRYRSVKSMPVPGA